MSERAAYWRQLLVEWERSGLSQAEFCRRQGLKAGSLAWWKRRLRGTDDGGGGCWGATGAGQTGFVEVSLPHGSSSAPALRATAIVPASDRYEIVLPSAVCVRLAGDFDPERVARLVQALAAAC